MIYTSGAPRNSDPTPWDCYASDLRMQHRNQCRFGCRYDHYAPRPEYALPPVNPNPYLQAFRDYLGAWPVPSPVLAREWLELPTLRDIPRSSHLEPEVTQATSQHARHATLVLLRIAELDRGARHE